MKKLKQIFKFLLANRKYWIMPVAILLIALAIVIFTSQGSALAPFIYTIF